MSDEKEKEPVKKPEEKKEDKAEEPKETAPADKEEKSKLKLAKKEDEKKAEGGDQSSVGSEEGEKGKKAEDGDKSSGDSEQLGDSEPVAAAQRIQLPKIDFALVNKSITVLIGIVLVVAAADVTLSIVGAMKNKGGSRGEMDMGPAATNMAMSVDLSSILSEFKTRDIFDWGEVKIDDSDSDDNNKKPPPVTPVDQYVRENLKLMGTSRGSQGKKAIIMDKKQNKMLFVLEGEFILIERVKLTLTGVSSDGSEVIFGYDGKSISLR